MLDLTAETPKYSLTDTWALSAVALQTTPENLFQHALHNIVSLSVPVKKATKVVNETVTVVPGHLAGGPVTGPVSAKVMVIGRIISDTSVRRLRHLDDADGQHLRKLFSKYGYNWNDVYVTSVVKFRLPMHRKSVPAGHIADCMPLLVQEILEVQPDYILTLGAPAAQALFGRTATLTKLRGAKLPFHPSAFGRLPSMTGDATFDKVWANCSPMTVMVTQSPAAALRRPELLPGLEADIATFLEMVKTGTRVSFDETRDYRYIDNLQELDALVDELIAENRLEFSIDCETGGEHFKDGWLRTIQISWEAGKAVVVILRPAGSQEVIFKPSQYAAVQSLKRLLDRDGVRIYGQNFRSDALWLEDIGLPVMKYFSFDTMLADHALNESQPHGLKAMALRYTTLGRYDYELTEWLSRHPQPESMGYANVPDEILHVYGATDADAVFRIVPVLREMLNRPENAPVKKLFETIIMPANQPIHEMERTGISVDTDRMMQLFWRYDKRKRELLEELRQRLGWPAFNPRSVPSKIKLLYGSPAEKGLGLTPIKTTEKPPREWADVGLTVAAAAEQGIRPSTDSESLELLSQSVPEGSYAQQIITLLQDFQTIDQITKNFLRAPEGYTEDANPEDFSAADFKSGLMGHVKADGRVYTTISQIKETGRHSSQRPALQNISKKMEPIYRRIVGDDVPKLRSCFWASEGHVLIEADYKSAEIVSLAYISGDPQLIADALGPVKLHAKVAVDVLGAPCSYEEVAEAYPYYYVGAKTINFGIPYQRGAKAIARQVNRDTRGKAGMTQESAREFIDSWYARYAKVYEYAAYCKARVNNGEYLETPFGRRRHFYKVDDRSVMAGQEREAVNFGIQATVADALNTALYNLWQYKRVHPEYTYKILLAIHDAVLLSVPISQVADMVDYIIPLCMTHGVTIPATARSQAFKLGADIEIMLRWGEKPNADELLSLGIPKKYVKE